MFEVGVINYGVGNIVNVLNALNFLEIESLQITKPSEMGKCKKLILPGVGAFDYGVKELLNRGFFEALQFKAEAGVPILGICLGMQLMFEKSQESLQNSQGLGFFRGEICRLKESQIEPIPRIGWFSTFSSVEKEHRSEFVPEEQYFYYAHSFYASAESQNVSLWSSHDNELIPVEVKNSNKVGVQFHPEKSARTGLQYLKNFILKE